MNIQKSKRMVRMEDQSVLLNRWTREGCMRKLDPKLRLRNFAKVIRPISVDETGGTAPSTFSCFTCCLVSHFLFIAGVLDSTFCLSMGKAKDDRGEMLHSLHSPRWSDMLFRLRSLDILTK
ncbi:hypothetical protein BS78_06G058600 [Paspalum vaginatum]|nr:hypothetical protein BS78_06G058600 [Paspalum vaginatum]